MATLKMLLTVVLSFIFGFGFWYLIFWFITAEVNLFLWSGWTKAAYLLMSFAAVSGTFDLITKD